MDNKKRLIILGGSGGKSNEFATDISLTIDDNYILSCYLINKEGEQIGTEQTIDLPLESMIVSGSYDDTTKSLILELDNGNEITIPISDLINGLQEEITSQNPLSCDLLTDGQTNKVYTATEQTKLSGIASGAEVNVQSDWNESDSSSDSFILNKPTLGTMAAESASDYTPTSSLATVATTGQYSDLSGTPTIPTVNDSTITIEQDGVTAGTFTLNQSSNATISLTGGGGNQWFGTQTEFDNLSTYDDNTDYFISGKIDYNTDIKNTPNLNKYATKIEVDSKNAEQDGQIVQKMQGVFMTQSEFDNLTNKQEGVDYFIEGNTVEMVVTFTDQSTATYYVMVD